MTEFRRSARAPGKLVFLGEYVVVDGAPAVVASVDRYALARSRRTGVATWKISAPNLGEVAPRFAPGSAEAPAGPLRLACMLLNVLAEQGALEGIEGQDVALDSSQLFSAEGKLGLGSSTAVLAALHHLLVPTATPAQAFSRIDEVHRRAQQGLGSGVDVAAAVTGGITIYSRGEPPSIEPVRLPDGVSWSAVYTGVSVSTAHYLAAVTLWRTNYPADYAAYRAELTELAVRGADALRRSDGSGFCHAAGQYGQALGRFGRAAGVDIESMEHTALAALARRNGVHYKVSGAGGGAVGVACSTDPERLAAFNARVPAVGPGFRVLSLTEAPALWK